MKLPFKPNRWRGRGKTTARLGKCPNCTRTLNYPRGPNIRFTCRHCQARIRVKKGYASFCRPGDYRSFFFIFAPEDLQAGNSETP